MLTNLIGVLKALDEFMSRHEYFAQNPQVRYKLLDWHCQNRLNYICIALYREGKMQPYEVEDLFRREFFSRLRDIPVSIMSYFFSTTTWYRFNLWLLTEDKKKLQEQIADIEVAQFHQKLNSSAESVDNAPILGQDNSLKLPTDFKLGGDSN